MTKLSEAEINRRLNELYGVLLELIGGDIPLPAKMLVAQFLPKLPAVLTNEGKQEDLLVFLSRLAWVIGYCAEFYPEGEKE